MKIKCIKSCNGVGYEKFKKGEVRNLPKSIAEKLIKFGYGVSTSVKDTDEQTGKDVKSTSGQTGKDRKGADEQTDKAGKSDGELDGKDEEGSDNNDDTVGGEE